MLENVCEGLNAPSNAYFPKVYLCKMYPTCVSSKLCEFIFLIHLEDLSNGIPLPPLVPSSALCLISISIVFDQHHDQGQRVFVKFWSPLCSIQSFTGSMFALMWPDNILNPAPTQSIKTYIMIVIMMMMVVLMMVMEIIWIWWWWK